MCDGDELALRSHIRRGAGVEERRTGEEFPQGSISLHGRLFRLDRNCNSFACNPHLASLDACCKRAEWDDHSLATPRDLWTDHVDWFE
jgi:hypothetical protein